MIFSETRDGIERMHAWVREFCGAHEMEINAKKTVFIATGCSVGQIPILVNVEGDEPIEPHDENHFFKYLGVWIRVKRDKEAWSKQLKVSSSKVSIMRSKIYSNRLDILMAVHVCNTVLIPQLELAGRFALFKDETLRNWNSRLIRSILAASGEYNGKILSRTGFNQVTGLIHPRDAITSARIMDVANRLSAVKRLDAQVHVGETQSP